MRRRQRREHRFHPTRAQRLREQAGRLDLAGRLVPIVVEPFRANAAGALVAGVAEECVGEEEVEAGLSARRQRRDGRRQPLQFVGVVVGGTEPLGVAAREYLVSARAAAVGCPATSHAGA